MTITASISHLKSTCCNINEPAPPGPFCHDQVTFLHESPCFCTMGFLTGVSGAFPGHLLYLPLSTQFQCPGHSPHGKGPEGRGKPSLSTASGAPEELPHLCWIPHRKCSVTPEGRTCMWIPVCLHKCACTVLSDAWVSVGNTRGGQRSIPRCLPQPLYASSSEAWSITEPSIQLDCSSLEL